MNWWLVALTYFGGAILLWIAIVIGAVLHLLWREHKKR